MKPQNYEQEQKLKTILQTAGTDTDFTLEKLADLLDKQGIVLNECEVKTLFKRICEERKLSEDELNQVTGGFRDMDSMFL